MKFYFVYYNFIQRIYSIRLWKLRETMQVSHIGLICKHQEGHITDKINKDVLVYVLDRKIDEY